MEECSTMAKCYRSDINALDNYNCPSDESCAFWKYQGKYQNGCIRTGYCDMQSFYRGEETTFLCSKKKVSHWIFIKGKDRVMVKSQDTNNAWTLGIPFNRAYYSIYD